jgi:hypothetical protein
MAAQVTDSQKQLLWSYIEKSTNPSDTLTFSQLFAIVGIEKLQNTQFRPVAAALLGVTEDFLKEHVKRIASGNVITGLKLKPGKVLTPEMTNRLIKNPIEPDSEIAPLNAKTLQAHEDAFAQIQQPSRKGVMFTGDFDVRTATTTLTMVRKVEFLKQRIAQPVESAEDQAKINREVVECFDKLNGILGKYKTAFNENSEKLDAALAAISLLQANYDALLAVLNIEVVFKDEHQPQ